MQISMFMPESSWVAPDLTSLPQSWAGFKRICIDCETYDPFLKTLGISVRRGGYIVGISVTIEDTGQSFYLPYRHQGGDNLDVQQVLNYMRSRAAEFKGELVGAKLDYDLDYLNQDGIYFNNVKFFRDVQISEPLIDELQRSFSLANIGKKYGIESKDEDLLRDIAATFKLDPKKDLWKFPARYVGPYAERDTQSPLKILREQEKIIDKEELWDIWNLESQVVPVLLKMRRRGVRIDQDQLAKVERYSDAEASQALEKVRHLTGVKIDVKDIMKNNALAPALEFIGIKLNKTKTGKVNIDKAVLAGTNHEVGQALGWARKVAKLKTTFAASIREHMVSGRIHCTFNQIARANDFGDEEDTEGARYGRLSCVMPNLQQQPSRDEFAKMWRSIYIPEEGKIWGCNDYSQQEPRWTTHFAAVTGLTGAAAAAKKYRDDPTTDNHQFMAELTGLPRKKAKDVYLGICYGEGGAKLCKDLGLPTRWAVRMDRTTKYFNTRHDAMYAKSNFDGQSSMWEAAGEEGQNILDTFNTRAPFVKQLANAAEKRANQKGFVRTVGGRRLHFPETKTGYDWTYKALNRIIQGSSADQTKTALVMIDREMPDTFLQLQVHDELDGSFKDVEEVLQVAKIMRECIPNTEVPFKVDSEVGPSWGEIKEVE